MQSKINYLLKGKGFPLVFVHGALGFARNFHSFSESLKEDYQCLLYDQRGHGKSFHQNPYTIKQLSEDANELIESLNFSKVFLVGHSLGGFASLKFASDYPQKVSRLIIVDASPEPTKESGEEVINLLNQLPRFFESRSLARAYFDKAISQSELSKVMADFLFINLKKRADGKMDFQFDREGIQSLIIDIRKQDFWSMISQLQCPTLYLRGEHSSSFTEEVFEKLSKYPLIERQEIKGAGHWLHHERPQEFLLALKSFLK